MNERERKLKELKLLQLKKEKLRLEMAERSKDVQEVQASRFKEGLKDFGSSVVHGASLGFSDEIEGAVKSAIGPESYEYYRDEDRADTEARRRRSPIASMGGEILGGGAVSGLASPLRGLVGTALEGAAVGLGETEETEPVEMAKDAAMAAGGASLVHGATSIAKLPFDNPRAIRARALGAGKKEMSTQFDPFGNIYDSVENLKKSGFLKKGTRYSPKEGKYVRDPYAKVDKDILREYETKASDALKKVGSDLETTLKKSDKVFTFDDLEKYTVNNEPAWFKLLDEFETSSLDRGKAQKLINEMVETVENAVNKPDISFDGETFSGKNGVSLYELNKLKGKLQKEAKPLFDKVATGNASEMEAKKVALVGKISTFLKDFVEDQTAKELGPKSLEILQKNNRHYGDLSQVRGMLRKKIAGEDAAGFSGSSHAGAAMPYILGKSAEAVGAGTKGSLQRANIGEAMEGPIGSKVMGVTGSGVKQEAARLFTPRDSNRREPQSVNPYMEATYPRNSEAVRKHRESFLQKAQVTMPEEYDNIKAILDLPPKQMDKVMPRLVARIPHFFEDDDFNRFNGIVPEEARPAAIEKIWALPMSNTEKTKLIDTMNRSGELGI